MTTPEPGLAPFEIPNRVFVNQTSVTVYMDADGASAEVARLEKGTPLHIVTAPDGQRPGWLYIQAQDGTQGHIKESTKVLTSLEISQERGKLLGSVRLGWAKIGTGTILVLIGAGVTYVSLNNQGGPGLIWYGAILVGLGNIGWGIEQLAFTRRALRLFDELWSGVNA
jgi:hypothetical protein